MTKSFALCLTYGANCGSLASRACPSVIFLNCCGLRLSCLIPSHIEAIAGLELSDILALLFAILTSTAEDKALNTYGNFNLVDVVTFHALSNGILKINTGPSRVISGFAIPVEEVYCRPRPVVFKVNSYCIFEIKLATYGAKTALVYVISKLGVLGINKTALAVLTLQAGCRLCVLTGVRNRNCNVNSGAVEGNNNDAAVFSYGVGLIIAGISNVPVVVTSNLEHVRALSYVLIYLGPNTVSICHIVSCVNGIPFCTEMSTCTCYCEGSGLSTRCAKVMSIEAGVTGSNCYNLFTIKTYLIFCTCCRGATILVRTFGNREFNLNVNGSALEGNSNCAASYVNLEGLILTRISCTPVVVTSNLKLVCTCCNVLIYLSIYAVSESHIVLGISGAPIRTTKSC